MKVSGLSTILKSNGRWIVAALFLGIGASCVVFLSGEELSTVPNLNRQIDKHRLPDDLVTLPKIDVKSIQASPFQSQLIALLSINGFEQRVLVGQQLAHDLMVKAIDINGVDILHRQQLHRYELKSTSVAVKQADQDRQSLQTSINLLSHEFHTTTEGLEVYSATQQGLSASLGLQNGDKVSKINGEIVRQPEDILRLLKNYQPNQVLEFVGTRQGQVITWVYQAQADD
jgi:hypothetical protein